jgi:hypothetical protein
LEEISHLTTEPEDSFDSIKSEKPLTLTIRINTYESQIRKETEPKNKNDISNTSRIAEMI